MFIASFGPGAGHGGSNFIAEAAFLMEKFLLLLIEVDELLLFYFEDFGGPKGAADVDVHVVLVRDKATCDREFTFLFAEEAN